MVDAERDVVGEGADGNVARAERHLDGTGAGGHERQRGAVEIQGVRELGAKKDIMQVARRRDSNCNSSSVFDNNI